MRTIVLGAGIGGLAAALRLGRSGHDVVVVDRDQGPPADVGRAFDDWDRRGVTQWRQYHVFRARARVELERSLPEVLERLREAGVRVRTDDEFAGLPVRRPVLEWILRREVEACTAVNLLAGTAVESLTFDDRRSAVTGVRTNGGVEITADLVVDAGGRRSPIAGWIAAAGYDRPQPTRMPCGIAYNTRYYEALPGAERAKLDGGGIELGDVGFMAHALAAGDAGTVGAIFIVPSTLREFRALGTVEGWEAAVALIPRMSEMLAVDVRQPLMDPTPMYGLDNVLAPWHPDGVRGPRRLAHLGDSWLVTNPNQAWGSSIALAQAGALGDAVDENGRDLDTVVDDFHHRTKDEVEQLFAMGCETDRSLQRRWMLPSEAPSADELDREAVLFSLGRLAKHGDVDAAMRIGRRINLLELPDVLWSDHDLIRSARDELERVPFDPDRRPSVLDRDEFLATVNAASPLSTA